MPIHDWTRVEAGIFHALHVGWLLHLSEVLNRGLLPPDYYALPEQVAGGLGPDVLTLQRPSATPLPAPDSGVALAEAPPKVRFHVQGEANHYAGKARAVVVRHVSNHRVVGMVEIVSPGNKNSRNGLAMFVRKATEMLAAGVHLLVVDLFPPSDRDPEGIHRAIWGEDEADDFVLSPDKPLTCASYVGGLGPAAFVEPLAVGDPLPEMPLFLTPEYYVPTPLESTYCAAFAGLPEYWREVVARGDGP